MLLEIAIGDAYGAAFEYVPRAHIDRHNTLAGYAKHPRHALAPGSYTDDTQMSLAVAEVLSAGRDWSRAAFAERFVRAFKRDPREGYARGFYQFLCDVRDGDDFLHRIRADSDKSGGAMRACPVGLLSSPSQVADVAKRQAALTHNTRDGISAAIAAALSAHYFAYDLGPPDELPRFLVDHLDPRWGAEWAGEVGPKGLMSVRAAVTALARNQSLSSLLKDCVDFGGDVDTVAAIALGAASLSRDYERDLPTVLYDGLEDGPYGRRYIETLDRALFDAMGLSPTPGLPASPERASGSPRLTRRANGMPCRDASGVARNPETTRRIGLPSETSRGTSAFVHRPRPTSASAAEGARRRSARPSASQQKNLGSGPWHGLSSRKVHFLYRAHGFASLGSSFERR
jgi:ADP-ribosyl-[dinitrogen reductase] hydrolase